MSTCSLRNAGSCLDRSRPSLGRNTEGGTEDRLASSDSDSDMAERTGEEGASVYGGISNGKAFLEEALSISSKREEREKRRIVLSLLGGPESWDRKRRREDRRAHQPDDHQTPTHPVLDPHLPLICALAMSDPSSSASTSKQDGQITEGPHLATRTSLGGGRGRVELTCPSSLPSRPVVVDGALFLLTAEAAVYDRQIRLWGLEAQQK